MEHAIKHTDAIEQAKFMLLPPEQRDLMIWMNGRETNGAVAEALRDIAELKPIVERHDFWFKVGAIVVGIITFLGPLMFYGLTKAFGG